jgi:probable rRNA maturation factor
VRPRALVSFVRKLEREVAKGRSFDCLITGDAELRRLNHTYCGKNSATDVLSFPAVEPALVPVVSTLAGSHEPVGSIAISVQRARAQARAFGHSTEDELRILILHGVLHLLGYDHETDRGRMATAEKRWRARLGLPNGLIERVQS